MSWSGKDDALLMADDFDFSVASLESPATPEVLGLIDEVMGPGHDSSWFEWKHRDNPAGPSLAWVASDDQGLVGVRLFMRWDLVRGDSRLAALRPVDTVTAPRARRRGVFSVLVRTALRSIPESGASLVFNTPNMNSRDGYRRLGWTLMEPIAHVARIVSPLGARSRLATGREVLSAFDHARAVDARIRTERTAGYARWRYDDRSGRSYSFAALEESDLPNAIVYRVVEARARVLVVEDIVGTPAARKALVGAAARSERALLALDTGGVGGHGDASRLSVRRGSSVVAVLPIGEQEPDVTSVASWSLTLGDVEDVI